MLIEIENVSKRFGSGRPSTQVIALDNVSMHVDRGEFVSIVGPSGCGKTTLTRLVSGLEPPTEGLIRFDGAEVKAPIKSMGMAFQHPTLLPWRTVLDNVLLPIELLGWSLRDHRNHALEIIETAGLSGFESNYPDQLSGGMQQRVGICRALVTRPELLIMDEPFAALDLLKREEMAVELSRIAQVNSVTTLFVTHSITEAVYLSDRVVVMSARPGRIVEILDVPAVRPRPVSTSENREMAELVTKIRRLIYERRE